jgi:protein-tyrosine phosphatase
MSDMDLPRALTLQGATNVRDLGGWPTADGRRVRFGMVYRSASLAGLTDGDGAVFSQIGLRTVCDLRGEQEARIAPSRLSGVTLHALSIEPSLGASVRDVATQTGATAEHVMVLLRRAYTAYALDWSHRYRALFDLLVEGDAPPLLFHCSAGKDRTGFGAALVLTALGVDEELVLEDYLATNRLWRIDPVLAADMPALAAEVMLRAHPELIGVAFDAIRKEFGSLDGYFDRRLGLGPARRERLCERLLE